MAALLKRLILRWCPEPLLVALKKAHYSRVLRDATAIEEPDFPVVRRLVAPGDRVLDIGANIGVYTKLLAEQVGPGGRVWSIEPIPVTWRILQHNARALGLANVEALNCAASDSDGTVTMEVPLFETGGENFYEAHIIETPGDPPPVPTAAGRPPRRLRRVTVQTRRLDSLFPDGSEPVSFVKCDVEGHELACLHGGREFVRRCKPAWLIEISGSLDAPESYSCKMAEILAGEGYAPYWFDGAVLRRRRTGDRSDNCFFLTAEHLATYAARGGVVAGDGRVE